MSKFLLALSILFISVIAKPQNGISITRSFTFEGASHKIEFDTVTRYAHTERKLVWQRQYTNDFIDSDSGFNFRNVQNPKDVITGDIELIFTSIKHAYQLRLVVDPSASYLTAPATLSARNLEKVPVDASLFSMIKAATRSQRITDRGLLASLAGSVSRRNPLRVVITDHEGELSLYSVSIEKVGSELSGLSDQAPFYPHGLQSCESLF